MEVGPREPVSVSMHKDGFGGILTCSDTVTGVLGWQVDDVVGARSLDFIHVDDHDAAVAMWMAMLEQPGTLQVLAYRHSHADGSWIRVEVTNRNLLEEEGYVECSLIALGKVEGGTALVAPRVSELKAIRSVRSGERLLRRLAEGLSTGIAYISSDRVVSYANSQCTLLLGIRSGTSLSDILPHLDDEGARVAHEQFELVMGSDREAVFTASTVRSAPVVRTLEVVLRGLAKDNEGPAGIVLSVDDITDRAQLAADLERRASTDPLTGCLNRAAILDLLQSELRSVPGLAVVFVDVDRMKIQNDLLGHAGGDALLVDTAARLQGAVRPGDGVGRIGGDEFVAICRGVPDREAAQMVVSRIAGAMSWNFRSGSMTFPVSAAVGAVHVDRVIDAAEALARADVAMYTAKRSANGLGVMWDETLGMPGEAPAARETTDVGTPGAPR